MCTFKKRLLALCLALCLLLSGCAGIDFSGYFNNLLSMLGGSTAFEDMVYQRPDVEALQKAVEDCCAAAQTATLEETVEAINQAFYLYDDFSTAYALSMIHYSKDLTDSYWAAEYNYCTERTAQADAALDQLYRGLAQCPLREELEGEDYFGADFFDYYDGESIYDETFLGYMEQEAQLQGQYYQISSESAAVDYYSEEYFSIYGSQMAQVLVELIGLRQQIAAYAGYNSYPEFAYDYYHARDYTPAQAASYLADVRAELSPLYLQLLQDDFPRYDWGLCSTDQTYSYVEQTANAMGGQIQEAFSFMAQNKLYDISYGANKNNISFEIFIPSYMQPYIFLNPSGTGYDQLNFAHEFGHFCNDHLSMGSMAGVDVAEIFSQGMEYLSLCYGPASEQLQKLKMADCLSIFVEQAALASFEHQMYSLQGPALTAENLQQLYSTVCTGYGLTQAGWDSRSYVAITHFYISPLYVVSYVVSNDTALQLYQMEQQQAGTGLACLENGMTTMQGFFLAFLEENGLRSPFDTGRIVQVKSTLQQILFGTTGSIA